MNDILKIWIFLANKFDDEHVAAEILSFSVKIKINYDVNSNSLNSCSFSVSFPGLQVQLQNLENLQMSTKIWNVKIF